MLWTFFKPRFNVIEIFLTIVMTTLSGRISWWANAAWYVLAILALGVVQAWVAARKEY